MKGFLKVCLIVLLAPIVIPIMVLMMLCGLM